MFIIFLLVGFNLVYGDANFSEIIMYGKYEVGHQDIHTKREGVAVSVYYPMDREEHRRTLRYKNRNTLWLRYGKKSLKGISMSLADLGSDSHPPTCYINYFKRVKMNTA